MELVMCVSSFILRFLNLRKIVIIILSAIVSCYIGRKENIVTPPIDITHANLNNGFVVYFLKNTLRKVYQIMNMNINDLEINSTVWLKSNDIEFRNYSTQYIYLKKIRVIYLTI